jgi:hypothetical protein
VDPSSQTITYWVGLPLGSLPAPPFMMSAPTPPSRTSFPYASIEIIVAGIAHEHIANGVAHEDVGALAAGRILDDEAACD